MCGLHVNLVTYFEIRSWRSPGIGRALVMLLSFGNLAVELTVEVIQVDNKIFSLCGGEFQFGVCGDVGVITFIGEEWRNPHSCTQSIVVGKLHKWKKGVPVILLVVAVHADILFQCLISMLSLPISFGMVS